MRMCSRCGAEDRQRGEGLDRNGQPVVHHNVEIDMVYMVREEDLTPKLRRQGWQYKQFQGRHARYRYICLDCMRATSEARAAWNEINSERLELEGKGSIRDDYYLALCE